MKTISSVLLNHIEEENKNREHREKKSFWATDCEKDNFEIYHKFIGTPETNPVNSQTLLTFDAGKKMEDSIVEMLRGTGKLTEKEEVEGLEWVEDECQYRFDLKVSDFKISGKVDAIFDNVPVEIKTFYGNFQERELSQGRPRTSYLKQLAMYMYAMQVDNGVLLYRDRGVGTLYQFDLEREGTKFKAFWYKDDEVSGYNAKKRVECNIEFDLIDVFNKFKKVWENVKNKEEPTPQYKYKYPIEEIVNAPKSKITKARTNKAVNGDWQVLYSCYRDLYIAKEKTHLGYNAEELAEIKEKTKGYSTW